MFQRGIEGATRVLLVDVALAVKVGNSDKQLSQWVNRTGPQHLPRVRQTSAPIKDIIGGVARDTVETHLIQAVATLEAGPPRDPGLPIRDGTSLTGAQCRTLYRRQLDSRLLDIAARWLRERDEGHYTIGSAGHEGNAAVAAALRPDDPALLHYRSGAFYLTRSEQAGRLPEQGIRDVLMGLTAAADEPIAGGRHKVFGHPDLAVIPQTSTIASHLPRAAGVAFAIERARALGVPSAWPDDAIAVCSFGDASINHASALSGFNTAAYAAYQGLGMPILFVCEDNGIGISVRTPQGLGGDRGAAARHRVLRRRRVRPGRGVRRGRQGRRARTRAPLPRVPAPAHGAADGPRRVRRRVGLPHAARDQGRPRARPAAAHGGAAGRGGA
ncbi:hypothetical protein GCM10020001_013830 [Nonomuraea salmonea]